MTSNPASMYGPTSFGTYSSCAACGPFKAGYSETGADGRPTWNHGEISYGNMNGNGYPSECGLASVLPGNGLSKFTASPFVTPCQGNVEKLQSRYDSMDGRYVKYNNNSVLDNMQYNWRVAAAQIPQGLTFRGLSGAAREAVGLQGSWYPVTDPYKNQTMQERAVGLRGGSNWATLLNVQGLNTNINYAGQGPQVTTCSASGNTLFNETCTPSPMSYGVYKQYGADIDATRSVPYRIALSNPALNPDAFSVSNMGVGLSALQSFC